MLQNWSSHSCWAAGVVCGQWQLKPWSGYSPRVDARVDAETSDGDGPGVGRTSGFWLWCQGCAAGFVWASGHGRQTVNGCRVMRPGDASGFVSTGVFSCCSDWQG